MKMLQYRNWNCFVFSVHLLCRWRAKQTKTEPQREEGPQGESDDCVKINEKKVNGNIYEFIV